MTEYILTKITRLMVYQVICIEGGNGTDNTLIIRNNIQNNGMHGITFPFQGSFRNILISENTFSNLSHQGVYQKFLINGVNLNISDNTFTNIKQDGIYIDGNSFTNGAVKIQNNILINVSTSNSSSGITIKNVQNAEITGNNAAGSSTMTGTDDANRQCADFSKT